MLPCAKDCKLVPLPCQVGRRSRGGTFRGDISSSHAAINNEISTIDEAALIAGKEEHRLSLLDSLTEAAGREVNLATVTLGLVITKPVLQECGAANVKP